MFSMVSGKIDHFAQRQFAQERVRQQKAVKLFLRAAPHAGGQLAGNALNTRPAG